MSLYEWSTYDLDAYAAFCTALGIADITVPLKVWSHESDLLPNPPRNGPAVGVCQFEPGTLAGLGYDLAADPKLDTFCAMTIAEQLVWATKYFMFAKGRYVNVAAFYLADFLPSQVHLAMQPTATVCGLSGPYAGAYRDNHQFDVAGKGYITPSDLTAAAERAYGVRGQAIAAAVLARVTQPDLAPTNLGETSPATTPRG